MTLLDLLPEGGMTICARDMTAQVFQRSQLFAAGMVYEIARHDVDEGVIAREGGAENHTGIVAHGIGQVPIDPGNCVPLVVVL